MEAGPNKIRSQKAGRLMDSAPGFGHRIRAPNSGPDLANCICKGFVTLDNPPSQEWWGQCLKRKAAGPCPMGH